MLQSFTWCHIVIITLQLCLEQTDTHFISFKRHILIHSIFQTAGGIPHYIGYDFVLLQDFGFKDLICLQVLFVLGLFIVLLLASHDHQFEQSRRLVLNNLVLFHLLIEIELSRSFRIQYSLSKEISPLIIKLIHSFGI